MPFSGLPKPWRLRNSKRAGAIFGNPGNSPGEDLVQWPAWQMARAHQKAIYEGDSKEDHVCRQVTGPSAIAAGGGFDGPHLVRSELRCGRREEFGRSTRYGKRYGRQVGKANPVRYIPLNFFFWV